MSVPSALVTTKRFDWQLVWKAARMIARDAIAQRWHDYWGETAQAILEGRTLGAMVLSPSGTLRNARLSKETAAALAEVEPEQVVDIQISEHWWDVTYTGLPNKHSPQIVPTGRWPESHWITGAEEDCTNA